MSGISRRADTFKDYALDQLRGMGEVDCRPMFGGHGLYHGGVFFGILFKGRLYFKTSPATVRPYKEAGMKPFRPSARMTLKNYYEVPPEVLDDAATLTAWADRALSAREKSR